MHPTPAQQIANWDYEADVVVAGYGIAGAAAAVEAAGADVLVLERTGGWGGAAAMAGGFIYLGAAPDSNVPAALTIPSTTWRRS
jgi:3-oxo-5alpha-steroid 4-dehydrogenase